MSAHWPEVSNGVTAPCHYTEGLHKKAEKATALPNQQRTGQAKNMVKKRPNHVLLRQMKDFTWGIFWIIQKNHCLKSCMQKWTFYFIFLWRTQCTGYTLLFILSHLERPGCCPHTHFHRKKRRQLKGPAVSSHWRAEANACCGVSHLTLSLTLTEHRNKWLPTQGLFITNQNQWPWLQLPKLLQSWLPTWLHLMDAGDKPKIKHCWQAAVTGTFRGWLEENQSRKKCNSKEKPLGQRNPRDTTETYFKVLREDWQKLLAITKKPMDIF